MTKRYVLLDDEGQIVRWFDYPATGTVLYEQRNQNAYASDDPRWFDIPF